jgi:hypothetical protein
MHLMRNNTPLPPILLLDSHKQGLHRAHPGQKMFEIRDAIRFTMEEIDTKGPGADDWSA